ncbi:slc38a2 [Symbiodinium sp. CCMP2592]|nr:slc38a2 [Symbiodinium sp. CCMP2592]
MTVDSAALLTPASLPRKHSQTSEDCLNAGQIGRYGDAHVGSTDVSRCILNVLLAVLGAGQLTLPYAIHKLGGLWQGAISLVLFTLLSMHSLKTLSFYELHFTPEGCLESYSQLVIRVLGGSGSLLCQFLLVFYAWGGAVAFLVILKAEFVAFFPSYGRAVLCGIACFLWRLSSCEDLTFLKKFSWLGCVVAVLITVVTVFVSPPDLTEQGLQLCSSSHEPSLLDVAAALPLISFSLNSSWAYIPVLCTLSDKSHTTSLIIWSNLLILLNYMTLAASGYCRFGKDVKPNIMDSLGQDYADSWMVRGAKVALCLQLSLALPLRFFVARKTIQDARQSLAGSNSSLALILVFGATAAALPDISLATVLGIVSGICASMIIYILPAIVDLRLRPNISGSRLSGTDLANLLVSLLSLLVGILILLGSLWANAMGVAVGS